MSLTFLTGECPGTGGEIKLSYEDFEVEEIPRYLPCGTGEHRYLFVEKRGLTTLDLLRKLARLTGVREREIGYAGLKDARGVTRQWLSLPGSADLDAVTEDNGSFRILTRTRHRNKLRLGHLSGNRFRIRIRNTGPKAQSRAETTLSVLTEKGVPNSFGSQRFGAMGNSSDIGRAILKNDFDTAAAEIIGRPAKIQDPDWKLGAERFRQGDLSGALEALPPRLREERRLIDGLQKGKPARKAVLEMPRRLLRLYVSAFQSRLFDNLVAQRLDSLGTLWNGDLAVKHSNGAFFLVENAALEQPRADELEISPSAPLFGYKSVLAQGVAGELELSLLQQEGIGTEDFRLGGGLKMEGSRRPLRVPLDEAAALADGADLLVSFALPAGSYATIVLNEIIKPDVPAPDDSND